MPTLTDVTKAVLPAGVSLAQYLASRRGVNTATGTVQAGATTAAGNLNASAGRSIAQQEAALAEQRRLSEAALAEQRGIATSSTERTDAATAEARRVQEAALAAQRGLYGTTVDANKPYSEFGTQSIKQLQGLQANPGSLVDDPGYKFELGQGLQAGQRAATSIGAANGGTIKAQTRYALDFANTKYNDAVDRLLKATGVGERANAANASAGVTLGQQEQANANAQGNIVTSGAEANNRTIATLGNQIGASATELGNRVGTEATNVGNIDTGNAENQAGLTLAQAELAAKNQSAQGVATGDTIGKIAGAIPTIAGLFKKAAPVAGAAAGALGAGGGGIIAGGALLAKHFIGEGRKAADKLTGEGGIQRAFEDTLNQIDQQPEYTAQQKWESKVQAYDKLKELALAFAKKGKNERKAASQMFDTIAPLFGQTNPLRVA